jgi:hypothetical protein
MMLSGFSAIWDTVGSASRNLNWLRRIAKTTRISAWAKFLPKQSRGARVNGWNRRDCGFLPENTTFSSPVPKLNDSVSAKPLHLSGFHSSASGPLPGGNASVLMCERVRLAGSDRYRYSCEREVQVLEVDRPLPHPVVFELRGEKRAIAFLDQSEVLSQDAEKLVAV